MKCAAVKSKDGKRCTFKANKNGACGIKSHQQQVASNSNVNCMESKDSSEERFQRKKTLPYVAFKIDALDAGSANPIPIVRKIDSKLALGPSKEDKHGYIYLHFVETDLTKSWDSLNKRYNYSYFKIGRTERTPERRCKEWPGSQLIASWECKRNRMAEYLIHKYLNYCRVKRWVMKKDNLNRPTEYLSAWWDKKDEFVADLVYAKYASRFSTEKQVVEEVIKNKKGSITKMEWFKEDKEILLDVIRAVVRAINEHWKN